MNRGMVLGMKLRNRLVSSLTRKDAGVNTLLVEAGLVIMGIALLLIFNKSAGEFVSQIVAKCLEKSLAILA